MKTKLVLRPSSTSKTRHQQDLKTSRRRVRGEKPLVRGRPFETLTAFVGKNEKWLTLILRAIELIVKVIRLIGGFSSTTCRHKLLDREPRKQEIALC